MTDRINLTELRNLHVIDSGGIDHGQVLVGPDDLLALIDLAYAAKQQADGSEGETLVVLDEALARFDFGL